jgi:hypothetical protein
VRGNFDSEPSQIGLRLDAEKLAADLVVRRGGSLDEQSLAAAQGQSAGRRRARRAAADNDRLD